MGVGAHARIGNDDIASRFVYSGRFLRSDGTVRLGAFMPRGNEGLSVTMGGNLSEARLWEIGRKTGAESGRKLHGRADVSAGRVRVGHLEIERAPTASNPNHAEIVGWPANIAERQMAAQKLAASADVFTV
jgi:hypothetical protein